MWQNSNSYLCLLLFLKINRPSFKIKLKCFLRLCRFLPTKIPVESTNQSCLIFSQVIIDCDASTWSNLSASHAPTISFVPRIITVFYSIEKAYRFGLARPDFQGKNPYELGGGGFRQEHSLTPKYCCRKSTHTPMHHHAQPSLPVNPTHNPTTAKLYTSELHDTAAELCVKTDGMADI